MNDFKDMANKAINKLGGSEKTKKAVEAAGDKIDKATRGRYADKIDKGQQRAQEQIDKATRDQDRDRHPDS